MPSCEKCWRDSGGNAARYLEIVGLQDCTPKEQAGEDAAICAKCGRKTIHQLVRVCMNPECSE